jgi:hypothetical protein
MNKPTTAPNGGPPPEADVIPGPDREGPTSTSAPSHPSPVPAFADDARTRSVSCSASWSPCFFPFILEFARRSREEGRDEYREVSGPAAPDAAGRRRGQTTEAADD